MKCIILFNFYKKYKHKKNKHKKKKFRNLHQTTTHHQRQKFGSLGAKFF